MADDKKPSKKTQPIKDVEEPGKSAASPTSKPVLVTNRPIMKDPMVVADQAIDDTEKQPTDKAQTNASPMPKGSMSVKIELLETKTEPNETSAVPAQSPAEPETDQLSQEQAVQKDEADKSNPSTQSIDEAKKNTQKNDKKAPITPGEEADVEASRRAERDANLQKIVDKKTYFLPINAVEKRKTKRFVALGIVLSLVLVVAWVDVALDAGLIELGGVKPVTHFFSN